MPSSTPLLLLLLLLLTTTAISSNTTLEYIDPTLPPLPATHTSTPICTLNILHHQFANTINSPPISTPYHPPPLCPAPWSRVLLSLSASASDLQLSRISAIWLSGAELLRSSTPSPLSPNVHWRVQKDVTRYTALLRLPSTFSMMLENSNATFPGVYSVNVSLHFYRGPNSHPVIKGLYPDPADQIVPLSDEAGECGTGFWRKLKNDSDVLMTPISIPNNTYRAVLELYLSHHDQDLCWYCYLLWRKIWAKSFLFFQPVF